jgi:hypothetical protein
MILADLGKQKIPLPPDPAIGFFSLACEDESEDPADG